MTIPEADPNTQVDIKKKGWRKGVVTVFIGTIAATTLGGALLARKLDESDQTGSHRRSAREAAGWARCEDVVQKNLRPGSLTAIVRLSSLTKQERADCGVFVSSDPQYASSVALDGRVVDSLIQLPTVSSLDIAASEATRKSEAEIDGLAVDVLTGVGGVLGFVGGIVTISGEALLMMRIDERRKGQETNTVEPTQPVSV